jgi:coenzyme Q-binding protein COQ10
MPKFSSKRRVHHSAPQMFDLVADVERYPEFVPLCRSLKIRQRTPMPDGTEIVIADMTVSFKLVREAFTSRVTLDRPNLKILVEYLQGPFSNLENRWSFEPKSDDTCDVGFFLAYEFKSRMLAMLMGTMFDTALLSTESPRQTRHPDLRAAFGEPRRIGVNAAHPWRRASQRRNCGAERTSRVNAIAFIPGMTTHGRDGLRRFTADRRGVRATRGCNRLAASRRGLAGACGPRASSINIRRASTTERWRTALRPIAPKRHSRCRILPSRAATAKCTRPTGLPGVAPPGPAMPVMETARSTPAFSSAPIAIAVAVSLLTAPNVARVVALTPSIARLASLE